MNEPYFNDVLANDAVEVRGKAVVISGGTTGIGRATAGLLVARGARVLIFGRHEHELNDAIGILERVARESGGQVCGLTADHSRSEDVARVFVEADKRIGGCDIMINNAAVGGLPIEQLDFDKARYIVESNLLGYIACAREALARMKPRSTADGPVGHIVSVGSMSADLREPNGEVYASTKAAVQAFSESLRKTANKRGIRVTLIEPGAVATPIQKKTPEEERRKLDALEMLPAEDIARCILFALTQPHRCDIVTMQVRPLMQLI